MNAGVRYDVAIGYQIDQSKNPNFVALQNARADLDGSLDYRHGKDFGQSPRNDYDNVQPRVGFALNVGGRGRFLCASRRLGHLHGHGVHERRTSYSRPETPQGIVATR